MGLNPKTLQLQLLEDTSQEFFRSSSVVESYCVINDTYPLSIVLSVHENKQLCYTLLSMTPDPNWQALLLQENLLESVPQQACNNSQLKELLTVNILKSIPSQPLLDFCLDDKAIAPPTSLSLTVNDKPGQNLLNQQPIDFPDTAHLRFHLKLATAQGITGIKLQLHPSCQLHNTACKLTVCQARTLDILIQADKSIALPFTRLEQIYTELNQAATLDLHCPEPLRLSGILVYQGKVHQLTQKNWVQRFVKKLQYIDTNKFNYELMIKSTQQFQQIEIYDRFNYLKQYEPNLITLLNSIDLLSMSLLASKSPIDHKDKVLQLVKIITVIIKNT